MIRLPREEISYKKLYKNLDIDRDLNISWPEIEEPAVIISQTFSSMTPEKIQTLDEYDIDFCKNENIDEKELLKTMNILTEEYKQFICNKLDDLKPFCKAQPCDICGCFEPGKEYELVTCTGCNITVHKECYGVNDSSDPFWFCVKCLYYFYQGECFACKRDSGVLKQTDDQRWVHVVCAVLNKTLCFSNPLCKEPVDTTALKKCSGVCELCNKSSSYLIKCSYSECKSKFHGSCAAENLYCDLNNKIVYCNKHSFTRKEMHVRSKRNMIKHRSSYSQLENDILIRIPCKLQKSLETEFLKIIKTEPIKTIFMIEKTNSTIAHYWSSKMQTFGTCFTDIFFYANYINEKKNAITRT
ncbi:hypothetical protein PAEPH01_0243 [Pancytospora epiphaga]|nr:hypothetical protein PAEPH01_0243 [Pancytospora epiphaga]